MSSKSSYMINIELIRARMLRWMAWYLPLRPLELDLKIPC